MEKILYVILHGFVNRQRYNNVVETWGKGKDCLFYSDYEDPDKNIIKVSDDTHYHSNEIKHIKVFNYLFHNQKKYEMYDWFFFCDDDTFVNTNKLERLLHSFKKDSVNGCCKLKTYPKIPNLEYCSGGAGYLIHKDLVFTIGKSIKKLGTGYSDVTLGIFLNQNDIQKSDYNYFNSQPPEYYNFETIDYKKFITFHYIKTKEQMNKLYELSNA